MIKAIEDAFLAALAPLRDEGVRTLESYAEQIGVEDLRRMIQRMPAVYVVWAGSTVESANMVDTYSVKVLVLVCDQSLRGEGAARRGSAGGTPGAYHWIDRVRDLLHRRHLIQGFARVACASEGILAGDETAVVCQAVYEMTGRMAA